MTIHPTHPFDSIDDLRFLTIAQVCKLLNYSRNHIYRLEKAGKFPRRYKVGVWRVGFRRIDIIEFMKARPQAPLPPKKKKDDDDSK